MAMASSVPPPRAEPLALSRWLTNAGASASALTVLDGIRGAEANDLRTVARGRSLVPGLFALVALDDARGLCLPIEPSLGLSRSRDPAFREATDTALSLARSLLGVRQLPSLRVGCEETVDVHGPSIGLPSALAFVSYYIGRSPIAGAVAATGAIDERGRVLPVRGLEAKLGAAARERGLGLVLVPHGSGVESPVPLLEVSTLAEAVERVFGRGGLVVAERFLDFEALRTSMRSWPDDAAIDGLSGLLDAAPFEADRLRVQVDLAARFRHLGRSDQASGLSERSKVTLESLGRTRMGRDVAEHVELQYHLGRMDLFDLDRSITALERHVAAGLSSVSNEIRYRGALAQALGMAGRVREALEIRSANVALHEVSSEAARDRAGTHVYLALDAARIGDETRFRHEIREMVRYTRPGDDVQLRFDAAAWCRGLVLLGHHAEAIAWLERGDEAGVLSVPRSIERARGERHEVTTHPEVSLVRALVRALGHSGRQQEALEWAERVRPPADGGLVAFLAHLVHLEASRFERDVDPISSADRAHRARLGLRRSHAGAARFHPALFRTDDALGHALDSVWY